MPHPSPISHVDIRAFRQELDLIGNEAKQSIDVGDRHHIKRVEWYGRIATILGYTIIWTGVNPVAAFLLSLGQFTRWLIAHHVTHRGYDKVPGIPQRLTSKHFAKGWRRFIDWFDWIHPAAWDYEHNILHHYHTGEDNDPDLAERYTEFLRALRVPVLLKYLAMAVAALTWKFTYYAPNTISTLHPKTAQRIKGEHVAFITIKNIFQITNPTVRTLWQRCYLPYGAFHFILIPLLFFPLGGDVMLVVLVNKLLAEAILNLHSFLVIGPNHTADDLYRYSFHYDNKEEFYITQIMGSVNYRCGNEVVDFLSIYLNYQIEDHLFPDLPMLKYRAIQPKVKALCEKHGVPYRQECVFKRFSRMLSICVGRTSMKQMETFPHTTPLPTA